MTEATIADTSALVPVANALTEFEKVSAGLQDLSDRYTDVVFAVQTTKGMDEAKAARLAIREPRYAVGRALTAAKKELNSIKKNVEERADQITAALLSIEDPIDAQIKAEETRKEEEKRLKEAAEQTRVAHIRTRISAIANAPAAVAGASSAEIKSALEQTSAIEIDETWEEFVAHAADAKDQAVAALITLHAKAVAAEEAQAIIAAQRAELEAMRLQVETQRAELEAARSAAEAAQIAQQQAQDEAYARLKAREQEAEEEAWTLISRSQVDAFQPALNVAIKELQAAEVERREELNAIKEEYVAAGINPPPARPTSMEIVVAVADHFDVSIEDALDLIMGINVAEVNEAIAEAA